MSDYAIDTASRFGEIPFNEFAEGLVSGMFHTIVESNIEQMEAYSNLATSLSVSLSTYINNTSGDVDFEDITDFVLNYQLPQVSDLDSILEALETPTEEPIPTGSSDNSTWWSSLITSLAPSVAGLVDKIDDPNQHTYLEALTDYNNGVLDTIPSYKQIHDAIAALLVSNKYGMLMTILKQGASRTVVDTGRITARITFSTWNTSTTSGSTSNKIDNKIKSKYKDKKRFSLGGLFGKKRKNKEKKRLITVNTAKSYQRDTSGTKVDIFGEIVLNLKTDYAPLNG
ncbi:hypothetical protein [Arcobacter sp. LA11]|uniref:hypothetical protein n=1 Tax=Arcobacter sp. LA11 TaxID=1898176 RepID=UPI000932F1B3|nr:hypothetical protein [Arcobacter sp. LA11]